MAKFVSGASMESLQPCQADVYVFLISHFKWAVPCTSPPTNDAAYGSLVPLLTFSLSRYVPFFFDS